MTTQPPSPTPSEIVEEWVSEGATAAPAANGEAQGELAGPSDGQASVAGSTPAKSTPTTARPVYPKRSSKQKEKKPPSFLMGILLGLLFGLLLAAIVSVVLFIGFRQDVRASQLRAQEAEQRVTELADELDTLRTGLSDMAARAEQLEQLPPRLDEMEQRGAAMGERLDEMSETMTALGSRVETMNETVGAMERRLGTLQERSQAFDAFLLGLRDLSLRANPLPESATPTTPTEPTLGLFPGTIRQGEALLITAEGLAPSTLYDIALINNRGEATLLAQARSSGTGALRHQLRESESTDITPGRYTIALYPEDDTEPVANGELRVTAR